jgi:hypothetical protein
VIVCSQGSAVTGAAHSSHVRNSSCQTSSMIKFRSFAAAVIWADTKWSASAPHRLPKTSSIELHLCWRHVCCAHAAACERCMAVMAPATPHTAQTPHRAQRVRSSSTSPHCSWRQQHRMQQQHRCDALTAYLAARCICCGDRMQLAGVALCTCAIQCRQHAADVCRHAVYPFTLIAADVSCRSTLSAICSPHWSKR